MFDLGVYNVTSLTGLIGAAQRVMAMSGIAIPERGVDDDELGTDPARFGEKGDPVIFLEMAVEVAREDAVEAPVLERQP